MKPIQIYWKIWLKFSRYFLNLNSKKTNNLNVVRIPVLNLPEIDNKNLKHYRIFDEEINLSRIDWKMDNKTKLFQYHIHYHDFLLYLNKDVGLSIIYDWIDNNQPSRSFAWDPYTISLRVVNWIKFISRYQIKDTKIVTSLFLQGEWLAKQKEYHILANHLFKNIIALLYVGYFFQKKSWTNWALNNLKKQVKEQLTDDGYHYEFSPTYHAIFVADTLDAYNLLINNLSQYRKDIIHFLQERIKKSINWTQYFSTNEKYHAINDVNYQDVPTPHQLFSYAEMLHIGTQELYNEDSRYYPILRNGELKIMFYCAPINPPYNPSHSHADMLSVLLWNKDKPLLVDTGNYCYEENMLREYSRSTKAHNTVEIDGIDQCELWKAFRIGKRGILANGKYTKNSLTCSYQYHERITLIHQRTIKNEEKSIIITDILKGDGKHSFILLFHFAPECTIELNKNILTVEKKIKFILSNERIIIEKTPFFSEMYETEMIETVKISGTFYNKIVLETRIFPL